MSAVKMPPVTIISGGLEFLRIRAVQQAVQVAKKHNRRIVYVGAGDEDSLRDLLSSGFLFSDATLAVIESSEQQKKKKKKPIEETDGCWSDNAVSLVVEHSKGDGAEVSLVIHHEGEAGVDTFAGQISAQAPKVQHKIYVSPKPWEEKTEAIKFLRTEMKRRDMSLSEDLAEQIVLKVGTERGMLSFEALKIATYLSVEKRTEATPQDVAPLIAVIGVEDWVVFKTALAQKNVKAVIRSWNDIRSGPGGDTLGKALSILTRTLVDWIHAAALHEAGISVEESASRIGLHSFVYKTTLLPAAVKWGKKDLESLLKEIVHIGVRKGFSNPWIAIESILVGGCVGSISR